MQKFAVGFSCFSPSDPHSHTLLYVGQTCSSPSDPHSHTLLYVGQTCSSPTKPHSHTLPCVGQTNFLNIFPSPTDPHSHTLLYVGQTCSSPTEPHSHALPYAGQTIFLNVQWPAYSHAQSTASECGQWTLRAWAGVFEFVCLLARIHWVQPCTEYCFRVRAVNPKGVSRCVWICLPVSSHPLSTATHRVLLQSAGSEP